jgi:carbon-monoxide dehydrogenase medium subunit
MRIEGRRFAVVGVAAILSVQKGIFRDVKIVLGAVAPKPMRARKAEEILLGNPIEDTQIEKASQIAAEESKPISDVRASAIYRREIVEVLTRKAIREAIAALSKRQAGRQ